MKRLDATDEQGRTKLMLAARDGSISTIKQALWSSNIFQIDHDGRTALFYAAERGNEAIIWVLLNSLGGTGLSGGRIALLEIKDKEGLLAEDRAKEMGLEEIYSLLTVERQRISFFE